jgi:hypothetical protein
MRILTSMSVDVKLQIERLPAKKRKISNSWEQAHRGRHQRMGQPPGFYPAANPAASSESADLAKSSAVSSR